jgi:curved DNA-binding protein CbpA
MGNNQSFENNNFNEEEYRKIEKEKKINKQKKKQNKKNKQTKKVKTISDGEYILDFDNDYNAYEILGLENNCNDENRIKSNYRKLALKYHPDKTGGVISDHFIIIKEAYKYLKNKVKNENYFENKINEEVTNHDYNVKEYDSNKRNIHLDAKNFNNDKFNEVFNDNRMFNPYDKGYGNLTDQEDELIRGEKLNNYNINNFNESFNRVKKNTNNKQMINYNGPEANYNCNLGFNELGIDSIDDFGESNKFTDYRKAYGSQSVLINENEINQRKEYRNLNEYKNDRSNLNFSKEDQDKYELQKQHQLYLEKERLEKQKKQDMMIESNFNRINSYLIIDH